MLMDVFGLKSEYGDVDRQEEKARNYIIKGTEKEAQAKFVHTKSPIGFLLPEKYDNHITDQFLDLMLDFIKDFIGEYDGHDSSSS